MLNMVGILQWSTIITIIHCCCRTALCCPRYEETNPQWFFSTLTAYNYVSPKEITNIPAKSLTSLLEMRKINSTEDLTAKIRRASTGTPVQLFMVVKHGATYPTWYGHKLQHYERHMMVEKLGISRRAEMCPSDIEEIKRWQPPKRPTKYVEGLVEKGRAEIIELAQRVQKAYPNIFIKEYKTAMTRRENYCKETGRIFLKTVFNDQDIGDIPTCNSVDNILMIDHYMEHLPNFKRMLNYESNDFLHSDDMKNVIQRVLKQIGRKPESHFEDYRLVTSLYNTCAVERSNDEKSIPPLCRVFCQEDLDVLEYMRDLIYYFDEGYGNVYSVEYACPMANRLLESLERKKRGQGPNGVFYFGNSVNILNLYVMLGLAKDDDPLMSSNYKTMKDRQWRTSLLAPLAANFMAVLFKSANEEYKVAFHFNEKYTPVTLNDGTTCEVCPWLEIKKKLEKYIQDCSYRSSIRHPLYRDSNPYWHFSTKTAYRLVSSDEIVKTRSDTPIQIFMVMRHDVTMPSDDYINEWKRFNVYKYKITAKARMCWHDIDSIRSWRWYFDDDHKNSKDNVYRCRIEDIANRIRRAFPNLFEMPFNSENYKVSSRPEQICKDTGEMFLQGLFKNKSITSVSEWEYSNLLLMVENLDIIDSEDIAESKEFKKKATKYILERVAIKMGLEPGAFGDDYGFIDYAYNVCRFERSYDNLSDPALCNIFCPEDLKALEYVEDLLWYYTVGYGNPANFQQACPMAKSLLETIKTKTEGQGPNGVFNFGNAYDIFHLHIILGLAKDDVSLESDNYEDMADREWRTSSMCPWLANFMAVLFKSNRGEYKVSFYFNERRTTIKLSDGSPCEVCPWIEIEKLLMKFIKVHQCN